MPVRRERACTRATVNTAYPSTDLYEISHAHSHCCPPPPSEVGRLDDVIDRQLPVLPLRLSLAAYDILFVFSSNHFSIALVIHAKAREYVVTGVGLCVCLRV